MCAVPVPPAQNYFKIYAGSTELSPFHGCYATEDTVLRTCAGRFFVHDNGDDMVAAYWALRKKAVLYDVPERPVEISGPEALAFFGKNLCPSDFFASDWAGILYFGVYP